MFQHPLHKRIISRVVFYGAVILFLWLLDHTKAQDFPQQAQPSASLLTPAS